MGATLRHIYFWVGSLGLLCASAQAIDPNMVECVQIFEREGRPVTDRNLAQAAARSHIPEEVSRALAWARDHGQLDILAIATDGPKGGAPHFTSAENIRLAYQKLENDPYSRLVLLSFHPEAFENAPALSATIARAILKNAKENPPLFYAEPSQAQVFGALATLARVGEPADLVTLRSLGKYGEWYKNSIAEISRRIQNREGHSAENGLRLVRALFADASAQVPALKFHEAHMERVADNVVSMAAAKKPEGFSDTDEGRRDLWIATFTHDAGKAFWSAELVSKTARLNSDDQGRVTRNIARAFAGHRLNGAEFRDAAKAVRELNAPTAPGVELARVTEQHREIIAALESRGIITADDKRLLLAARIEPSTEERRGFNRHYGGYRPLLFANGNDLAVKLAQLHHEWLDGKGYPFGLTSNSLDPNYHEHWMIRAITVADVFDSMTAFRPNSPNPKTPTQAIAEMLGPDWAPRLDPDMVRLLANTKGIALP